MNDVPPPRPETTVALLGLAVVLWLFARIQIIRRQLARGVPAGEIPRAPTWLVRLAGWPPIYGLLAVAGLGFGALLVLGLGA